MDHLTGALFAGQAKSCPLSDNNFGVDFQRIQQIHSIPLPNQGKRRKLLDPLYEYSSLLYAFCTCSSSSNASYTCSDTTLLPC